MKPHSEPTINPLRDLLEYHRAGTHSIDRVYAIGTGLLIVLTFLLWLDGRASLTGLLLLVVFLILNVVLSWLSVNRDPHRRVEAYRFLLSFFMSPVIFLFSDPHIGFLATYLFMTVGGSAYIGIISTQTRWSWLNIALWIANLAVAYSFSPHADWELFWVQGIALFMVSAATNCITNVLRHSHIQTMLHSDELARSQAKLARTVKFAALGEMAAGIAHEINTPLSVILLKSSQLMRLANKGALDAVMATGIAKTMENTARHIGSIIASQRKFSRDGESDPFQMHALKDIVREGLNLCGARIKQQGTLLEVSLPAAPIEIECRSVPITQVLVNLFNNAQDSLEFQSKKWIAVNVRDLGDNAEIRVSDSGPGIAEGKRPQLFQPFFTTKEIGKGTGLGLSISKGIIDNHHGRIFLAPDEPHTTFVIRLPKRQP